MKIIKKFLFVFLGLILLIECSSCTDNSRPNKETDVPENYYGPFGYAEEIGDVEVVLVNTDYGQCYMVVDFSESSKNKNVIIVPDNIGGIPVINFGLCDQRYSNTYEHSDLYFSSFDVMPDGSIVEGIDEDYHTQVFVTDEKTGEFLIDSNGEKILKDVKIYNLSFKDFDCNYLYYYNYPQFNNTGVLDSLYISCQRITNFLPLFFLNWSENSKIVLHTDDDYGYLSWIRGLYLSLAMIISKYQGQEIVSKRKTYHTCKIDFNEFKPKLVLNKLNIYYLKNINESYIMQYLDFVESNISFRYNLEIDGQFYHDKKSEYYQILSAFEKVQKDLENLIESGAENDKVIKREADLKNLTERLNLCDPDSYWIDYNEEGDLLMEPPVPYIEGYKFLGWYKDKECIEKWDFAEDVVCFNGSNNLYLYAKWEKSE